MNKLNTHNLDILSYSFKDLQCLFALPQTGEIDMASLKRAKQFVLSMHPDKSKLPSEYFLFYKRALDIVVNLYKQKDRFNRDTTESNTKYDVNSKSDSDLHKVVTKKLSTMDASQFHEMFNTLFEENMAKEKVNTNSWFEETSDEFDDFNVSNISEMGKSMNQIKKRQNSQVLSNYRGVSDSWQSTAAGSNLYGDTGGDYISCDAFGKLKYDDLRKVHKDQTVFAVDESAISNRDNYKSYEELQHARNAQDLKPLNVSTENTKRESQWHSKILEKEFESEKETIQYESKNKQILSHFLRISR